MAKEILLYTGIYSDTAAQFLMELEAAKGMSPLVRVCTPGGDPFSTYGMIAKANEVGADYQVDGRCDSCGFYLVAGSNGNVECLDQTTFIAHRAASWMEDYPDNYPNAKADVEAVNKNLRAIIEKSLPDFEKVTGVKLDDMFSMEGGTKKRIDVRINAKQALKMGLVSKVNPLTAKKKKEINAYAQTMGIAAIYNESEINAENNEKMEIKTLAELKAAYPALVAQAETEATTAVKAASIEAERKRIAMWNKYRHVDAKVVDEGINSGKEVDIDVMSDMQIKMASPAFLEAMKKQNTTVTTANAETAEAKTEDQIKAEAMFAAADKEMFGEKK